MPARFSGSAPVLVRNTSCGGDVVLTVCDPNVSADGNTAMPDASVVIRPVARVVARSADADAFETVEIVSVDCAPLAPGVTTGGSNVQPVCGGRLPAVQVSVTAELYA